MITLNAAILGIAPEPLDDFDEFVADQLQIEIDLSISRLARLYRAGFPLAEIMRRHRPLPNYSSLTGALYGLQKEIGAHFESPLAKEFMMVLDFDRAVESFTPKPLKVSYSLTGHACVFEPAVLVHYLRTAAAKRPCLFDIRSERNIQLRVAENEARTAAATAECAKRGWQFAVLTEKEIRTPYLSNAKFLLPFRKYDAMEPENMLLRDAIPHGRTTTPQELMTSAFRRMESEVTLRASLHPDQDVRRGRMLAMMWKIVADGFLLADFHRARIAEDTEVWSPAMEGNKKVTVA